MVGKNNNIRTIKSNLKEHYKAYKAGSRWVYASLASLALGAGLLLGSSTTTYADTTANDTQEPNETVSNNSAATAQTTSSVTLKSGDNTQTAADATATSGSVNGTSDSNDSSSAATNATYSASSTAEKAVKQATQNTPATTSESEAATSDTAAQQATATQAKTSKTLVNPTEDQLNAAKATADAAYAATQEPQEIDAVDPASVAPLTISSTAVGYGSNAQSPLTLTLQINAKAGDVYKINIPADDATYKFDTAVPLASAAGTTTTDNNSDGSHTITDIFTTNSTTTQPIKIDLNDNYTYQLSPMADAGKTITKTITYSVNGVDQTPITFTQTIQPTANLSTVSLLYPNSHTVTEILPNQNYVFGVSVNEADGVKDDGGTTARVNSAVNYGGAEINIPVPTGFVLDANSTNEINGIGDGTTITQPGGKGTNIVINVPAGKGNQARDAAPEYKLVGAFDVSQTATDQTLTANGNVTFSQVINADGTKLTDSADPWSVTILPANADATQGTNVVLTSMGNSSLASDKLEFEQDSSDDPQYLNSFGFKFDSAAEAQNAKLTMTIPSGLDVTSIKTPVQGISSTSYLPDTSSWTFTFTLADGTTQTGTVNAGEEAKVTGNSAIRTAVFTPNKLAPGSYADDLGTSNSFLLAGQLSTTYDDGTAVKNGDQLTSSVDMTYDAKGTSQEATKSSATQTIVDNIAIAQGTLVKRSSAPGNQSAGTLETRYNDGKGQTTNKIYEPTFYFVIPKVTTVSSINSLWWTNDPLANPSTTDPTGKLLTQATGAKVSEFTADNGQTVVKIDYAGTGTTVDLSNTTGYWGAVTFANDADALPGKYPYYMYVVSPTTKLLNSTTPTDLSFVENNTNAYLLDGENNETGQGDWTIETASSFFNTSVAKGNQNVDAVQKATSDKNGDSTLTFYDNVVYTSLEDVAADHNASVAINLPTAGTDKSQYTFKLTGAIDMPTNYTTPSGDGTAINSTVLYSTQPQTVNTTATAPDTTGYVTKDQVTDWSTIRSIIIQINGLKANTSTGRIAISGTTDNFKDQGGKTAYLQTIFYGDGAPASVSQNDENIQNEASITITGTSTIKARYHYVDADGNDQYVNLTDLSKTLNDGVDTFTNDYPTQLSDFSADDQALIPAGYKLETDASGKVTPTIVDGSTDGQAVFGQVSQNSFDGDFVQYDLVGDAKTQVEYIDDDGNGAIVGTPQVISGTPGGSTDWSMDQVPTGYTLAKNQVTSGTYTFKASGNMPVQIHLKHIIDESTATTTRTITYSGAGDKTPEAKSEPVTWTVGTDEVTGITTYTPSGDYDAVPTPSIAGYTADKSSVAAVINAATTTKPVDVTVEVTYSADDADLTVNYVDTDNDNQVVETDTVTGKTDDTGDYTVTVPTNYVLAPGQDSTVSYQLEPGDGDNLTIKLKHAHSTTLPDGFTGTTTRTITYTGAGTNTPADKAEPVTWTTDTDEVTGVTTYTPSGNYEAVPTPSIAGYTADKDSVPAATNAATTTKPTDSTETVTYTADAAGLTVTYEDVDNGNAVVGTPETINGTTDETGTYTATAPAHYEFANADQPTSIAYTITPDDTDNIVIPVKHAHSTTLPDGFTGTTTRTITYTGAGTNTPADKTEPVTWTTDTDEVTGITIYTPSGDYDAVPTPSITGYTADKESVPAGTNTATTTKPVDVTVEVTYTADNADLTVNYVDTDNDNQVVETDTVTGKTDDTGDYTVTVPTNYVLAPGQDSTVSYQLEPGDGDNLTIKLMHAHSTTLPKGFDGTTTRTITYTGAGSKTPADKTEPVTWTTDTDEVTGVTTYTPSGNYDAVPTPSIAGYTADRDSVPAATNAVTTTLPTDSTETVTYTPQAQSTTVEFVDDDDNGAIVGTPTTLNGVTDGTANWNTTGKPTSYALAPDQSASGTYTFKADNNTPVVIHLVHKLDYSQTTSTRTIHYVVDDPSYTGQVPAPIVQTITWNVTTDEVTGESVATPQGAYYEQTSPNLPGYIANPAKVGQQAVGSVVARDVPMYNEDVVVTYTPQPSQPTGPIDGGGGVPDNQPEGNSDGNPTETPENDKTPGQTVTNTTTPGQATSGTDSNGGNGSSTGSNTGSAGSVKTSAASATSSTTTAGSQNGSISNGNSNTSATNQQKLPQTNEQSQSTVGLGLLGLLTSMLGLAGLKRRKRDDE
ncbi:KxYKxGKxW signal peptide domain-containing protein [Lactobacillus sp. LC28-10]|uniref:KxYKxGKxW signal peptide domain-containing protein n=1 Tax=Secundilactobacillus angelensis TaxID=2722706 RepID=A0ABX1KVA2_9LACO|nr:KxYKxGKxW signal peptide domain-containing protein [Secundilactobacillus angelensis]MCH5461341.1 KxYKxGKxW signal peptide domain-containing protein [Secundilactobacillus angelensis]NLR17846.1 KxYKxGKxW signal peptide domain-containing protein [Secundilactobacillus angelensis]